MAQRILRSVSVASIVAVLLMVVVLAPALAQSARERIAFQRDASPTGAPANVVVMFSDNPTANELPASADLTYPRVTPSLSPDGHLLAFASKVGEHFKLFTWALDDQNNAMNNPLRLSPDEDTDDKFPAWSPDGQRLAYLAIDANKKASLRIINKDGTDMKVMQEGITYFSTPSWSKDGDRLLYIDNVKGKPTLTSTSTDTFLAVNIRAESKIIAACYSPDGQHIAAMIANKKGVELWSLSLSGRDEDGSRLLVEKIVGCSSVAWLSSGLIVFNATKVGAQAENNEFWFVDPATKKVAKSLPAYASKDLVRYFTASDSVAAAAPQVALNPTTPAGPDIAVTPPPTAHTADGAIVINSPNPDAKVSGKVMLKMNAQANVATLVLRIGTTNGDTYADKFSYDIAVDQSGDAVTEITHEWDTQELATVDPTRGILLKYADLLRYPDQTYTLVVNAFDKDNKPVGTDSIKVTVANSLPDDSLPPNLFLRYNYVDPTPEEHYVVHGEGNLAGAYTKLTDLLDVSLDAMVRRDLVEARANNFDVRTYLDPVGSSKYTLTTQSQESSIPEQAASALYTLSQSGDLSVIPQRRKRIILPLSQIVIPFSQDAITVGATWSNQMWVVADLLSREATLVHATFTVDGVEMVNGDHAVRIRAEYHLDSPTGVVKLALRPTDTTPGLQEDKPIAQVSAAQVMPHGFVPPTMGAMVPTSTSGNTVDVNSADGIRFAWFDIDKNKLVRIEDQVLYSFQVPYEAPPAYKPRPKPTPAEAAAVAVPGGPAAKPAAPPQPAAQLPTITYMGKEIQVQPGDRPGMFFVEGLGNINAMMLGQLVQSSRTAARVDSVLPPPPAPGMAPRPNAPGVDNTPRTVPVRYLVQYSYRYQPEAAE